MQLEIECWAYINVEKESWVVRVLDSLLDRLGILILWKAVNFIDLRGWKWGIAVWRYVVEISV